MSWDPDELPDVESMSEIPGSALGTVQDESVNESVRDEQDLFGSVGNNTQEFQEHSPLHNSASSTSSEEEQVLQQDGQVPFTEVMSPKRECSRNEVPSRDVGKSSEVK